MRLIEGQGEPKPSRLIVDRFFDGESMESLAKENGLTVRQVEEIVRVEIMIERRKRHGT